MKTGLQTVLKAPSTLPAAQVGPKASLEKRTRRTFTPEYMLRIFQAAKTCKHGELGALLRREKLYSNQLSQWRREYADNGVAGLSKSSRGPAPQTSAEQREIDKLSNELDITNDCLDIQKKVLSILDRPSSGNTPWRW